MTCPVCGGKAHVLESRSDGETVRRRRECLECGHRFITQEMDTDQMDRRLKEFSKIRGNIQNIIAELQNLIDQAIALNI